MTLSTLDKVRLEIGDTDPDAPLLNDEEVQSYIDTHTFDSVCNVQAAGAACAEAIAARFARGIDFAEDGQSFHLSQRAANYRLLAQQLRARAGGSSVRITSPSETAEG